MITDIEAHLAEFVAIRRDLHAHPELCFSEERTASRVAGLLERWGIPVTRGIGRTGVVGVIRRGQGQRAIGLRADMDALPLQEHNRFAHASRHEGRMHACGHDGHTAMLLAAARHLALHAEFDGTVVLIFQPAEEGGTGALAMMEDGLFDRFPVDAVFAAHNWPGLPVGSFAVSSGPMMASCNEFSIVVHGKGAHAAMPDQGVDAIQVAFQIGTALQTIVSRNVKPMEAVVLSVTQVHAGDALNVLPDSCELRGTVRCFSIEARDFVEARMRELVQQIGAAHGARCEMHFKCNCPPTTNHPFETAFVQRVLRELAGPDQVRPFEPTMSAEDFSFMLLKVPGAYGFIGNGKGGKPGVSLHNAGYDFNDDILGVGAQFWDRFAREWFKTQVI